MCLLHAACGMKKAQRITYPVHPEIILSILLNHSFDLFIPLTCSRFQRNGVRGRIQQRQSKQALSWIFDMGSGCKRPEAGRIR